MQKKNKKVKEKRRWKKAAQVQPEAAAEECGEQKKKFSIKRLLFGEETPDLSELEAGSTTILDILSPTSVDTKSRD